MTRSIQTRFVFLITMESLTGLQMCKKKIRAQHRAQIITVSQKRGLSKQHRVIKLCTESDKITSQKPNQWMFIVRFFLHVFYRSHDVLLWCNNRNRFVLIWGVWASGLSFIPPWNSGIKSKHPDIIPNVSVLFTQPHPEPFHTAVRVILYCSHVWISQELRTKQSHYCTNQIGEWGQTWTSTEHESSICSITLY